MDTGVSVIFLPFSLFLPEISVDSSMEDRCVLSFVLVWSFLNLLFYSSSWTRFKIDMEFSLVEFILID